MQKNSSDSDQLILDIPVIRVYKDGRVERLAGTKTIPAGTDSDSTGVQSKDVAISQETGGVSARLFLPKLITQDQKLPLLIYIHGGAFCIGSPFSPCYHKKLNTLASQANVVAVSVHYRLAPEHPLPICYDDSWAAVKWAAGHSDGEGPEEWLNRHADFERVFFAGDSAGGNICHTLAMRVGAEGVPGLKLGGLILVHPFFGNDEPDKILEVCYPARDGADDPMINPAKNPKLGSLGCRRVLVLVAGNDVLKERGYTYYEALKKSGWSGEVEIFETEGEGHAFHLFKAEDDKAVAIVKKIVSFIN